jgi:poly-gamma-glutamate synthesis protein (capsule biosynthesis protein)
MVNCGGLMGQPSQSERSISLILFGDVNLGRMVGKELLRGDTGYPFRHVLGTLSTADVVFLNLESQLSDQDGETQHPKYNLIFTGPPSGAVSLRQANVSVVSTANNHAFDYGMRALRETIVHLQGAGVQIVGTSFDSVAGSTPAIVEREGIRIGFLAYTEFVNQKGLWVGRIALYDSVQCRRDIEQLRRKVDLVVVSYHGGVEYTDSPSSRLRRELRILIDAGADVVVGHHPHYVQGIESYNGKLIFYSLGNFVFYQPQRDLAMSGLGVELTLGGHAGKISVNNTRLLAVRAGLQPTFTLTKAEEESFFQRLKKLSPVLIEQTNGAWFVNLQLTHD